jgi:REP element-mobilizing transposase RayT
MNTSIPFRGFDERGDVRIYYHGILPHWRQKGCTYFVTYRLADALPAGVIREFEYERNQWLLRRGIDPDQIIDLNGNWNETFVRLTKTDQRVYERMMAMKLNQYLDAGHGSCVLKRPEVATIVADSLSFFDGKRVLTGDFVVMPNHVHVLMRPIDNFELEEVLQAIKSYTATKINRMLGHEGRFWMRESYDHIVRDSEQLEAFQSYICGNPIKAKLKPGEYLLRAAQYYLK